MARLYATARENVTRVTVKLSGYLRSMVEFKARSGDSNKQRQPAASWWLRFLGYADKARLSVVEAEARTVDDVKAWVSLQVAPSLALLQEALGFDKAWAFLYAETQEGRSRWGPRHKAILAAS